MEKQLDKTWTKKTGGGAGLASNNSLKSEKISAINGKAALGWSQPFSEYFWCEKKSFLMIEVVLVSEIQLFESKLPYIECNQDTP